MANPASGAMSTRYAATSARPVILETEYSLPIYIDCQRGRVRFIVDQGMRMDSPTRRYVAALVALAINLKLDFSALQHVPTVAGLTRAVKRLSEIDPDLLFDDLSVDENGISVTTLNGTLDFSDWYYDGWLIQNDLRA